MAKCKPVAVSARSVDFSGALKDPMESNSAVQLRDEALAKPLRDGASAHAAVRQMLAKGLADPYTRFLAPQVKTIRTLHRIIYIIVLSSISERARVIA